MDVVLAILYFIAFYVSNFILNRTINFLIYKLTKLRSNIEPTLWYLSVLGTVILTLVLMVIIFDMFIAEKIKKVMVKRSKYFKRWLKGDTWA